MDTTTDMDSRENDNVERMHSMIPSQDEVEVGEEYLIPTTLIRPAHGGNGDRYEAIQVKVTKKHVTVNESSHIASEGYSQ